MPKVATRGATPQLPQWPADQVERRKLDDLLPYARNARIHSDAQIAQIAASIREWGWTIPVLCDETGNLIAGHGRVLAARALGLDEVPTMTAHGWSEAKIRAYRIADNQLALLSSWDEELLGGEIVDLRDLGAPVDLLGFDAGQLDRYALGPQAPDQFGAYDETIPIEHVCPKCGFRWSGNASGNKDEEAA